LSDGSLLFASQPPIANRPERLRGVLQVLVKEQVVGALFFRRERLSQTELRSRRWRLLRRRLCRDRLL
jgi:hypothetical protein